MREVFGDGRLVATKDGGFGVEAPGLRTPALLLPGTNGTPVPDLSAFVGKVLSYSGALYSSGDNLETISFHCLDLQEPSGEEPPVSPMWAVISGNLGKAPETNPKCDRITASIAYDKVGESSSWLRISAYAYNTIADQFAKLEGGTWLVAYGAIEAYDYNGKPRAQLAMRGYQLLARSAAPKPPTVLMAGRSEADTAAHAFDEAA